jgi:hypothetical protein
MSVRHNLIFDGALMAQEILRHHHWRPREKPNGASALHWVFFNGALMAQRGSAALRFRSACSPLLLGFSRSGGAYGTRPIRRCPRPSTGRKNNDRR